MNNYRNYGLWINGQEVPALGGAIFAVENPTNKQIIARVAEGRSEDVDRAVAAAQSAFPTWTQTSATERFHLLCRLAQLIRENSEELARWETLATGRPIREMHAQVKRLSDFYEYFAATARTAEGEITPFAGPYLNYTRRVPLGVVGLITPWNHPLLILTKKLAPALAAGNTVVVKPSEYTPLTTLQLARIALDAGLPDGVFNVVTGFGAEAGAALCSDKRLRKLDLTGGTETGRVVAKLAGENLIRVTCELGGKAPVIVLPDADLDRAAAGATLAAFVASGQTCVAGTRVLVHESQSDALVERMVRRAPASRIAAPPRRGATRGPPPSP